MADLFTFPIDNLSGFGQNQDTPRASQPFYETQPVYSEDVQKPAGYHSASPVPASQAEPHMPGLSSTSGPSIASASSSAIGSPYSGTTQGFQDTWVDTNHGLGLADAMAGDMFSNDFMGNTMDAEAFYQKKCADNYVGKYHPVLLVTGLYANSVRPLVDPLYPSTPSAFLSRLLFRTTKLHDAGSCPSITRGVSFAYSGRSACRARVSP